MEAYEARKPSYFGTPAVNLVSALNVSLDQILKEGLEARFKRHRALGGAVQAAMQALELDQVPLSADMAAHTLSAPKYPKGVTQADLLPKVQKAGVTLAGGLHPVEQGRVFPHRAHGADEHRRRAGDHRRDRDGAGAVWLWLHVGRGRGRRGDGVSTRNLDLSGGASNAQQQAITLAT